VQRAICVARCDAAWLQIEEARAREDEAGVHGNLSPMQKWHVSRADLETGAGDHGIVLGRSAMRVCSGLD
jgi:hypothetical protein